MSDLSDRQKKILEAIVKEYVEMAEPVGSENLVEKYGLNVSSATVRNEMVNLTEMGFLAKPHTSAGRIPTVLGFRLFIKELMKEETLAVVSEVAIKQRLWDSRRDLDSLLRSAVSALSDETRNLSLAITPDHRIFYSGACHLLNNAEFWDIDVARTALRLLDEMESISGMLERIPQEQELGMLLGEELGYPSLNNCGTIVAHFQTSRGGVGSLAVFGPVRQNYGRVIPILRYFRDLVNELGRGW